MECAGELGLPEVRLFSTHAPITGDFAMRIFRAAVTGVLLVGLLGIISTSPGQDKKDKKGKKGKK